MWSFRKIALWEQVGLYFQILTPILVCKHSQSTSGYDRLTSHSEVIWPNKQKGIARKRTLTQKQRHPTVWRREACPPLCPERAAGWFQGPGDTASHWGSSVCLLFGCRVRKHEDEDFSRHTDLLYHAAKPIRMFQFLHFQYSTDDRHEISLWFYFSINLS